MKLIVCLGNPGEKYEDTWHNCGFMAADALAKKLGKSPVNFKLRKKFQALVLKAKTGGEDLLIAKPQTFMNDSGRTASAIASYYKIDPENVWAIYDDLDLPLGKLRIRQGGSSGGHKGVQSLIDMLKTERFPRFRMGIGPDQDDPRKSIPAEKFVLRKFTGKEKDIVAKAADRAAEAIMLAIKQGIGKAMDSCN